MSTSNTGMIDMSTQFKKSGIEVGPKCCMLLGPAGITSIALFVIAAMGAAGHFPGSALGYRVIGLSGAVLGLQFAYGNCENRNRQITLIQESIYTALIMAAAGLSIGGVISSKALGWITLGTMFIGFPIMSCVANQYKQQNHEFYQDIEE